MSAVWGEPAAQHRVAVPREHLHQLRVLRVPHPRGEIFRPGEQHVALGMPPHPLQAATWAFQCFHELAGADVPDGSLALQAAGGEEAAVVVERHGRDGIGVRFERRGRDGAVGRDAVEVG